MRTILLTFLFGIFLCTTEAQQNNLVSIATVDSIPSQILKEQRKIWIHVPASAGHDKKKKYPVLYLLDGERNFTGVAGITDFLSSVNGNDFFPEMIIVGIPNSADRFHDFTPTHEVVGLWIDSSMGRRSGGGEAFTGFLATELIPHIDSVYPTIPYRMLIGHSLGALMVINTLVHHKNLFRSYVAIDPSMWWDDRKLLHQARETLATGNYDGRSIFLAMAETQPPGMDTITLQMDTTESTIHARSILLLRRYILVARQNGLDACFKYYEGETHGSVPLTSTLDALHFIFKDYRLVFQDKYFSDPSFKLAAFLKAHYEMITRKYGFTAEDGSTLLPPEDQVNNLGFFVMQKKQFDKAADMFNMNIKNYPAGSTAYGYLGDLYSAKGDTAAAKTNYKKSLALKENLDTQKKLEKLEGK